MSPGLGVGGGEKGGRRGHFLQRGGTGPFDHIHAEGDTSGQEMTQLDYGSDVGLGRQRGGVGNT